MSATVTTPTRADLEQLLADTCRAARRDFPVVGNAQHPTPWDIRHARLNALLDQHEAAG